MRGLFALSFVVLILLSMTGLAAQQDQTTSVGSADRLQLVDYTPFGGAELATDGTITLYFDRPLECAPDPQVTITPPLPLTVECSADAGSLTIAPGEGASFALATTYQLKVDKLRGFDGVALAEAVTLSFDTPGFLRVSDVLPAPDTTEVEADSVITVIFNRPVVPLVIREEADTLPNPLTITPNVAGKGEWLNTSIYVFRPQTVLAGGTTYLVEVAAGLTATDGSTLPEAFSWSFSTINPRILSVTPEDGATAVRLNDAIRVEFNQPMNQSAIEAAFSMFPADNPAAGISGTFAWNEAGDRFDFRADEPLDLATTYNIRFDRSAAQGAGGDMRALAGQTFFAFSTVPAPAIIETSPFDGANDVSPYTDFTIYFASPMDEDSLADRVTIEPEPWREPDAYYSTYSNRYSLSFPVDASTEYTITIEPGMQDIYGNTIDSGMVVTFTTDAYDSQMFLQAPGGVGFYNANNDATQLFVTHRNVSRLDLELYRYPTDRFTEQLANGVYFDVIGGYETGSLDLLRQWQIDATAPENAWRYELLNLGEGGAAGGFACPGAPSARLQVGDTAVVVTDPDPLNARAQPVDGEVLARLYRDYSLPVVGGPLCADGFVWWEVELRDESTAWVAEGDTTEYYLDVQVASQVTPVDLTSGDTGDALAPGVYLLQATTPEFAESDAPPQSHIAVVANANVMLKTAVDNVMVWVTDVNTGAPLANIPVTVDGVDFAAPMNGVTDENGLLVLETPRADSVWIERMAVVQTDDYFGVGSTEWADGIEPYQFGQRFTSRPEQYRTYLYTDRPIYRPDQPVYFRGIIREQDDVTYTPPPFAFVNVAIINENGDTVYDRELPLTPFGTFSDRFDIAADAPLGYYRIVATEPGSTDESFYRDSGTIGFSVAEYRAPEFQVDVSASADEVVQNETIEVTVDSRYFFGGVVSDATVEYNVVSQRYFFDYEGQGRYSFIDFNYDSGPGEYYYSGRETIASGEGTTDANGQFMFEVPATIEDATQSVVFTIEALVTDESDQLVAGRTEVVVHQGLIYVGVQPESYVARAGDETRINLIAVDWESDTVADQPIDVAVVERRWMSVQEEDPGGRTTWTWEVEEIPVTSDTVTTDANGRASFTFTPPSGGVFKVIARSRDAEGNEVVASQTLWVSSSQYVAWRQQNSNRIDLIADNDSYNVGDTAQVLITSPFQGTTEALITIERGDILEAEHVTMTSNSYVYELPITADFAPNVYVSVMLVKGVDENNPVAGFRMGVIELGVDNSQKEITIEIEPDREQAGPQETVTYTVRTTDYNGDPVRAEVGVGLTDLAVLTIADPNSGPLLGFFYGDQGLGIRTSTSLTINTDQITQNVLDTIKGGGGGFGEGGIFDIREEFVDTPYWNATLVTDEDGFATFDVRLPDNLTTWRLDARAVTSGEDGLTLVGQDTFDLLSTRPLLIRPITPRFFVVDDETVLAAIVNNNTESEQTVEVTLQADGVALMDDMTQMVTIPAGNRQRVNWRVRVEDVAHLDLTFFANGNDGEFTDASKPPLGQGEDRLLPVYRYEAPETVGTGGVLRSDETSATELIALPRRFDVTQGELTVEMEPSLAATTLDGLEYLQNFPHQCVEQTVSRFLPNIMTYRALNANNLADPDLERDLENAVNFALQRLYAAQKVDGGWGWFVQDDSNPLTTAYALIGLAEAQAQGFPVSDTVITRAANYVQDSLRPITLDQPDWRLNRQAFMLYALARAGRPDVARTVSLFEERERLQYYARAYLALTFHIINPEDQSRTDTLISDLVNGATLSATGVHWTEATTDRFNWNTDTRTTAIALSALVTLRPESDLIPGVVRYLMVQRTADAWESTQETAWAVMALTDWMVASGELDASYEYSAQLNGETIAPPVTVTRDDIRDARTLTIDVAELLRDEANRLLISRGDGTGNLYYTAHLEVYLPVPEIEPLDAGIIIERRYTIGEDPTPVDTARVGDNVQVRLTVIVPSDLHYVVIEDPIPAGTDAVNPDLVTSQQIGTQPSLDSANPLSRGWGWWYFSNIEFRDEKVVLYSTYLPAGTYEYVYTIRAGLAGTYNVIPPTASEFYFPEVYGRGAGSTFTIVTE